MARFRLPEGEVAFTVRTSESVTAAARRTGVLLDARCGGHGVCKGCTVELRAGRVRLDGAPLEVEEPRLVQGCRCLLLDDRADIRVPRSSWISSSPPGDRLEGLSLRLGTPAVQRCRVPPGTALGGAALAAALGADRVADRVVRVARPASLPADAVVALHRAAGGASWEVVDLVAGDAPPLLGLAADVGTTTVEAALVDLESGRLLGRAAAYDRQMQCGDDVAARIAWAGTEPGRRELQALLVEETLEPLAQVLCAAQGRSARDVRRLSAAGNPTMIHLLLGLDPTGMGAFPFRAVDLAPDDVVVADLGLELAPEARVSCLPAAAPYVGGDALAGALLAGMRADPAPCLLVDLGTNAEILLSVPRAGRRWEMLACAAPAGPAMEGMQLECGGRAGDGAVRRLALSERAWEPEPEVIGGSPPVAICGSAYLDFLAEGRRVGLLRGGRMTLARAAACPRVRLRREGRRRRVEYVVAERSETRDGDRLVITEADVGLLSLAKAAIRAGIDVLLDHAGLAPHDLGRIWLAGGMSAAISVRSVLGCGLLPDVPAERVHVLGNTALAGAAADLLDVAAGEALRALAQRTRVLELNRQPSFERRFAEALRA